jgi:alpha-glucosidase
LVTTINSNIDVTNEEVSINLKPDVTVYFPEEESLISHYENSYPATPLSAIADSQFCTVPIFFKTADNISILFTETGLTDYPGLFLKANQGKGFVSKFPKVIKEVKPHPRHADRMRF